jgi:outer membrane protein OmpA-like peptidoglycan-associated protein
MYSDLEKEALDKGVVELAKAAFEQARNLEAEKYAPKYFNRSKKELDLALGILATDRTRTDKANEHAKLAAKWARNAGQISELAKTFTLRDFSYEDTVLWYWQQLTILNAPFQDEIDFQQTNHVVIQTLQKKISDLKKDVEKISMESQLLAQKQQNYTDQIQEEHRKEILKLNSNQSEQQRVQAEKERANRENKQKFIFTQSLFQEKEAQVYRKGDNILISANGFYFPSGEAEIQTTNFVLLNKILSSIHQFPKARIEISGHTDSSGAADNNMKLSEKRAQNVADFLTNVGQVSAGSILAKGYGSTKPIAVNTTREGRDQNRRIDVMIINE